MLLFSTLSVHSKDKNNQLSRREIKQGWQLLFDGKTLDGWRTHDDPAMTDAGWSVEDNCIKARWGQHNKNIISIEEFGDFELCIEWKLCSQGNSGIMYHCGDKYTEALPCSGQEYQLIDDCNYPQELKPSQLTGVDYGVHLVSGKKNLKPIGEFNRSRIVFSNGKVEHWLNGQKLLEYQIWTEAWNKAVSESIWKNSPCYGTNHSGAFVLQNYPNSTVWFKNIKIRRTIR